MGHAQGCSRLSARRDLVTYSSFLSLAMVSRQVVFCCQYWGQLPLSHCGPIVCVIPEVDDMDGYQDDGYEEAILPTDFVDGRDGDYSVICTNDLHDARASSSHGLRVRDAFLVSPHEVLLGVPQNVIVTVVMDLDFQVCVWMKSRKIFERMIQDEQLQHRLWYQEKGERERLWRIKNTIT